MKMLKIDKSNETEHGVTLSQEYLDENHEIPELLDKFEGKIPLAIRNIMGITKTKAASDIGISRHTLRRFEQGKYRGEESLADRIYDYYAGKSYIWGRYSEAVNLLNEERAYNNELIQTLNECVTFDLLRIASGDNDFEKNKNTKYLQRLQRRAVRIEKLTCAVSYHNSICEMAHCILSTRIESPDYFATTDAINICGDFWINDKDELIHSRGSENLVYNSNVPVYDSIINNAIY